MEEEDSVGRKEGRRRGASCSCCLNHGDLPIMDGRVQDEFVHCTDPGLEQERINVKFLWIKNMVPSAQERRIAYQRLRRVPPFRLQGGSRWEGG